MGRHPSQQAEVVGVGHQTAAHPEFPYPIHHDPSRQRVPRACEPLRQSGPAAFAPCGGLEPKRSEDCWKSGRNGITPPPVVAALENERAGRLLEVFDGERRPGRIRPVQFQAVKPLAERGPALLHFLGHQGQDLVPDGLDLGPGLLGQPDLFFVALVLRNRKSL